MDKILQSVTIQVKGIEHYMYLSMVLFISWQLQGGPNFRVKGGGREGGLPFKSDRGTGVIVGNFQKNP